MHAVSRGAVGSSAVLTSGRVGRLVRQVKKMEESSTTDVSSSKPDLGRATNKAQPDGSDDDNDNTKLVITILTVTLVVAILVMGVVILVVWRRRQLRRRRAAKAAMLRARYFDENGTEMSGSRSKLLRIH